MEVQCVIVLQNITEVPSYYSLLISYKLFIFIIYSKDKKTLLVISIYYIHFFLILSVKNNLVICINS